MLLIFNYILFKVIKFHTGKFKNISKLSIQNATTTVTISSSGEFTIDPEFATSYPNLINLNMIFNKLYNDNKPICINLKENSKLINIELRINHLSQFPSIESKSAKVLDISQNEIKSITVNISQKFPNLRHLRLERNRLQVLELHPIPNSIIEIHMHVNNLPCDCNTYNNFKKLNHVLFKKKGLYCNSENLPILYADESGLLVQRFNVCDANATAELKSSDSPVKLTTEPSKITLEYEYLTKEPGIFNPKFYKNLVPKQVFEIKFKKSSAVKLVVNDYMVLLCLLICAI